MSRPNPYVGPRAFTTGEPLYGRDGERAALLDLLIAERVVVLHSPSGAGKSSLLHAGLIPDLIAEGFTVWPVIRVGMELPADAPPGMNRYVASALRCIDDSGRAADLTAALAGEGSEVLIFDQFEEVLTLDVNDRAAKHAFFAAIGVVLRSPRRWAVFAMREEFVASLTPYVRAVPTRMKAMFQLDLLGPAAAMAAAQQPARAAGVEFTDAAARRLIDDLRQVKVQGADGATSVELGPFVEPVQLQVACRNLWARLPDGDASIEPDDIAAIGDVDAALTGYYEAQVAAVAGGDAAVERAIRGWFERALITEQGLRGQVLQTAGTSAGLANVVIARLIDAHLVRAEQRRGMTWFELSHDRMLAPVRASNARWTAAHLSPVQRQAELWDRSGRPESLLLQASAIDGAAAVLQDGAVEREFLAASRQRRAREAETARLRRESLWQRRLMLWGALVGLAAAVIVLTSRYRDEQAHAKEQRELREAEQLAREEAQRATARAEAEAARALARRLAAELTLLPESRIDLAALLAVAASRVTDGVDAQAGLYSLQARAPRLRAVFSGSFETRRVAASADGSRVAALDVSEMLWQWDGASRAVTARPGRAARPLSDVTYDESRGQFVTAEPGGRVTYWAADGAEVRRLDGASELLTPVALAVGPGGAHVATADELGVVLVRDAASGDPVAEVKLQGVDVAAAEVLRFAHDGQALVIVTPGAVWWWAWRGGEEPRRIADAEGTVSVRHMADGALIGLDAAGTVRRWARIDGAPEVVAELAVRIGEEGPGAGDGILGLGLADDGRSAVAIACHAACARTVLRVWDAASERIGDAAIVLPERPRGRRLPVRVGDGVVLVGGVTQAVRVFDTEGWRPIGTERETVRQVAFSPDARLAAVVATPGRLGVYDLGARSLRVAIEAPEDVIDVTFFAGGTRLAALGEDGGVRAWDVGSGAAIADAPTAALRGAQRLFARGEGLLAVAAGRVVRVVDAWSATELHAALPGVTRPLSTVTVDAGATRIAAGGCDESIAGQCVRGVVHVWGLDGTIVLPGTAAHAGEVSDLEFDHAAGRLLSVGGGSLRVWDLAGGTAVDVAVDGGRTAASAWSGDDELVATLGCAAEGCVRSGESELRLFAAATLEPVAPARLLHSPVLGTSSLTRREVRFAPGGTRLYTVSGDGVIGTEVGLEAMREAACRLAGRELTAAEWARHIVPARPQEPVCPPEPAR